MTEEKKAYADITIVLDGSGSMDSMKEGVVDGINNQVRAMRRTPGDSRWTLVQFDDPDSAKGAGEEFPKTIYAQRGETEVPLLRHPGRVMSGEVAGAVEYRPRGGTALVYALTKTIEGTMARISGQDHIKVTMMVVTDGQENHQVAGYSSQRLRELVAETTAKGFQYIYLGANQDSFAESRGYGIGQGWSGGHLSSDTCFCSPTSSPVNNYQATNAGFAQAVGSGFVGLCAVTSGAILRGQMVAPIISSAGLM